MSIFTKLRDQENTATQSAVEEYISLLGRMNVTKPTAKDQAELGGLLKPLGKNAQDAERDYKRVQDVARLGELADTFDDRKAEYSKASKAHAKLCAKHQKLNKKMQADMKVANGNKQHARSQWDRALEARRAVEAIDLVRELGPKNKSMA